MHVLGRGKLIGALPTMGEGTYPATAQALSDVVAYLIAAGAFERVLRRQPLVSLNLLRFAAAVIQSAHRRLR